MGKLKAFSDTFSSLTGRSGRHNRALRDVKDLLAGLQGFFSNYDLQKEKANFESLLENIGYAKFDLTNLTYHTRPMIKTAKDIKGVKVSPIVAQILKGLEDFRRVLINPALRKAQLREVISELHKSVTSLQDELSGIEYK